MKDKPPPKARPALAQSLTRLGYSRSHVDYNHAFIAPDGHVKTPQPAWKHALVTLLISPQMGARFSQYLVTMQAEGEGTPPLPGVERFIYVLEGSVSVTTEADTFSLEPQGFAFLPADDPHFITATTETKLSVLERRFILSESDELLPIVVGNLQDVRDEPFLDSEHVSLKKLLPDDPKFDLAINIMTFQPGATLPFVETHVMEHGLLMLTGEGLFRLGESWYPTCQNDAIWMGPYCPQWFGALGQTPSSYLLYKEVNRDAFTFEKES